MIMEETPGPVQRGRYAVHPGDGGFVIAYTRGLCETCADCGCGDQASDPLDFTRKGIMKTVMRARGWMAESGLKLPALAGMAGDKGPRRAKR